MPTPKKKKKKYDYKKIAKQTKEKVKASSKRKGSGGGNVFKSEVKFTKFSPAKDEDHSIDIIPFECGDDMPWDFEKKRVVTAEGSWDYTFEYWRHSGIGPLENESIICVEKTWKEPCPICEHRRELIAEKAFDSEKMGNLYSKRRNLYNLVCYDTEKEEERGVQLIDVTWHWFEKYISKLATKAVHRKRGSKLKVADPFKNLADPSENGVSIEWTIEGARTKNDFDDWMNHQLVQREYDLDEALLDAALQLDQIVEHLSYAELYERYYDEKYEAEEEEESGRRRKHSRDEDEEEVEEDEPEEEEESDDLDGLDRKELKAILKEEEIDFKVYKSTEDADLAEAIREARSEAEPEEPDEEGEEGEEEEELKVRRRKKGGKSSKKKSTKSTKKRECPHGGTFGADFEEFDECDNCKLWASCDDKFQEEFQGEGED